MRILFFSSCFLISFFAYAQETTIGKKNIENSKEQALERRDVLLIPFEKNMYRSDADNDIAQASGISVYELRTMFRNNLLTHLEKALEGKKSYYSLLNENPSFKRDFDYLNYSTAYKYESEKGEKENEKPGTGNGQLTGYSQRENRFMKRIVSNPKSLEVIHKKYGSEFLIFINQMDIGTAAGTEQNNIINETFNREIKVHYTIIDKNGSEINSGAATTTFPYKMKKINDIINNSFPTIAQKIIAKLP